MEVLNAFGNRHSHSAIFHSQSTFANPKFGPSALGPGLDGRMVLAAFEGCTHPEHR
jgi:hypothetical protein